MSTQTISTSNAPAAIGPYSQAVVAAGLVFTSGQIALDPATGEMVGDNVSDQTEQVFKNLFAVLAAAGATPRSVVRCTVFLKDLGEFAVVNEIYARHFPGEAPPARACIEAARLPKDALVEIDAIAVVG
jgi:2-iminobutanoate/2-iminopropanoate deaminase